MGGMTRTLPGEPRVRAGAPRSGRPEPSLDLFTAVATSRASQVIASQIRGLIQSGQLKIGDRLPSERDLGEQFRVSRVTVREAFRILEAIGLVTIRVGGSGGAFVTSPTSDHVGESLADMVAASTMTAEEVTEARKVFEVGALPLVCARATTADLAELRAMLAEHARELAKEQYTADMTVAFHLRVVDCAHNEAISMLARALHEPMVHAVRTARSDALREGRGRKGIADYGRLIDAIEARDAPLAESILSDVLARSSRRLRERRAALDRDAQAFNAAGQVTGLA